MQAWKEELYRRELYHHGILGQKWGKRNGPPYPLGASDHSANERKAGWRKSLNGNSHKKALTNSRGKSNTNNKAGDMDEAIERGRKAVESILSRHTSHTASQEIKRLAKPESLDESLSKANPLKGTHEGRNNCVPSAIAGFMRQAGYDVTARSTNGKMQNTAGVVEECFKGAKIFEGSAVKFGRSRQDAAEMLVKRFGKNASGLCSVDLKRRDGTSGGHCFSWKIKDGGVSFFDHNIGKDDDFVTKTHFSRIDTDGQLVMARLDDSEIDMDAVKKYVSSS